MEKGKLIGQGGTAEVFEFGEDKVLKLFKDSIHRAPIENEYRMSLELHKAGMPVVRALDLIETDGRCGIIYERAHGSSMLQLMASKPWMAAGHARRLAQLHCEIQKPIPFEIQDLKSRLISKIMRVELLEDETRRKLCRYVEALPEGNILCHGDFHPDNILIHKNKAVIIDWMDATTGDPAADVARTSIIFKHAEIPQHKSYIAKIIIKIVRNRFYSSYTKHYLKLSKTGMEQIERWELPMAAARLLEGISPVEKAVLLELVKKGSSKI